jgi:hypothetical protein
LNELSSSLNEIDRNEYASHIRLVFKYLFLSLIQFLLSCSSVEHQIADIKQRLIHIKHLSIEHQTEYNTFEKNLHLFQLKISTFKHTIEIRLIQITIEDIRTIDVSLELKIIENKLNISKIANSLNAHFVLIGKEMKMHID